MLKEHLKVIVKELQEACDGYDETNDAPIIESIMHSGKIFIAGAGRTGYIMRCFAMRLIHLGFCAYVIGDTEMIAAKAGDLLLIGSGSGETKTLRVYMEKAKQLGMKTVVFTCNRESALAREAKFSCVIRAQSKFQDGRISVQPMGSLFEQQLLLLTDCITLELARRMNIDFEQLKVWAIFLAAWAEVPQALKTTLPRQFFIVSVTASTWASSSENTSSRIASASRFNTLLINSLISHLRHSLMVFLAIICARTKFSVLMSL